jgi:hypothetical protein
MFMATMKTMMLMAAMAMVVVMTMADADHDNMHKQFNSISHQILQERACVL